MRRVRYRVAMSLDGYIAGPKGEADWIPMDPEIDFAEVFARFDTLLVGRGTFAPMAAAGGATIPGMQTIVFPRTLRPEDYPEVTIVAGALEETVTALKARQGKDIWLFGGGLLSRSLAEAGLVDTVETALVPVLLGGGVPLLPPTRQRIRLSLTRQQVYRTGIVALEYAVDYSASRR